MRDNISNLPLLRVFAENGAAKLRLYFKSANRTPKLLILVGGIIWSKYDTQEIRCSQIMLYRRSLNFSIPI